MAMAIIRFDMRAPGMEPSELQRQYAAALEMATWADRQSFDSVVLSEHHGSEDNYLSSPLVLAGAIAGATESIAINVSALLVPLHDPLRLAEDLSVLDLVSGGRISIVAGLGYRPVEYAMFGRQWKGRGKLFDRCLEQMIAAWSGQELTADGHAFAVTPPPVQQPHPLMMIGGSGPAAAKRAARFGLGFFPPVDDQELVEIYQAECERLGNPPNLVLTPSADQPGTLVVAEDPDRAWAEIGPYLLHDARTYAEWQTDDVRSIMKSGAQTLDDLRAEGLYQILTPEDTVELAQRLGPMCALTLHPLCGGTPPELAWPHLELFADQVLPRVRTGG